MALRLLPKALRSGEQILCDKGYAGREFAAAWRGSTSRLDMESSV